MSNFNILPIVKKIASSLFSYNTESDERILNRDRVEKLKRILDNDEEFFNIISKERYDDIMEVKFDNCLEVQPLQSLPTGILHYIDFVYKKENRKDKIKKIRNGKSRLLSRKIRTKN